MTYGKLIVVGGNDGAGKRTQSKLLAERLESAAALEGRAIHWLSFPLYDTFWGKMVGRYLGKPEFGEPLPENLCSDPYQAAMLYELDRRAALPEMRIWLQNGDWIVCDRYTESNLAHQTAKFNRDWDQDLFLDGLVYLQHNFLLLPRPDLTIILSLPQDIRDRRVETRRVADKSISGQVSAVDRHEQDRPYMEKVNSFYPELAKKFNWPVINCAPEQTQLSVDDVHQAVWQLVAKMFNL